MPKCKWHNHSVSNERFRSLPSVDQLLGLSASLVAREGRARTVTALRSALGSARANVADGGPAPTVADLIAAAQSQLLTDEMARKDFGVINATGVILHTNLGRAPLSLAAQQAVNEVARSYSPLEYDLETGERGTRGWAVASLLRELLGCEDALVVNNCASATMLMLTALAHGKPVVIARGQLVEIGGGFRVPEIMAQSGALLREVGTTNRVRLQDYAAALDESPGDGSALLHVHPSNFKMIGFTQEVSIADLGGLVRERTIPVLLLQDLGSGALVDTSVFGLSREPMVHDGVLAGADVVCFSGDKLLGGPQAGILVGKRASIGRIRKHPLARAMRADKLTIAALDATLTHYVRGEAQLHVPVVRMMAASPSSIHNRATALVRQLPSWAGANGLTLSIIEGSSTVGGGSLPGETLPTALVACHGSKPDVLAKALRTGRTPVIARIHNGSVVLDLRTVLDDDHLLAALVE